MREIAYVDPLDAPLRLGRREHLSAARDAAHPVGEPIRRQELHASKSLVGPLEIIAV
jgi:hypothetical protein